MEQSVIDSIAHDFADMLAKDIGNKLMCEVVRRNDEEDCEAVCHSHDFCDANMVMADAFEKNLGRECDVGVQSDADIINAAWGRAKSFYFSKCCSSDA